MEKRTRKPRPAQRPAAKKSARERTALALRDVTRVATEADTGGSTTDTVIRELVRLASRLANAPAQDRAQLESAGVIAMHGANMIRDLSNRVAAHEVVVLTLSWRPADPATGETFLGFTLRGERAAGEAPEPA